MRYPPAPWRLQGDGFLTLQPVDRGAARPFVPDALEIVSVWPGRTLGGLYVGRYGPGSTLEYNELIVFAALARRGERIGAWISHICVDSPAAMAGGHAIWGLPKELAQFQREAGRVDVRQEGRRLCALRYSRKRPLWRQRFLLPTFSVRDTAPLFFVGEAEADMAWADSCWEIPPESPLFPLGLGAGGWSVRLDALRLVAHAPRNT